MWTTFTQQAGMLFQQPLLIGLSVLCIVGGLPLAMNLIPPNPISGVKVRKAQSDKRIWYLVNSYCGRVLILTGIISLVVTVALRLTAMPPATCGAICVLVLVGGLVLWVVATLIYLIRIK
jgi:uncharacterized membrane protein